jgi:hypothetical protein
MDDGGVPMKSSLFSRSIAFGALIVLSFASFSCNDSGSAGYDTSFNPDTTASKGVPVANLDAGTKNALDGLGVGQTALNAATTATQSVESDSPTPVLGSGQSAATAGGNVGSSLFGGSNLGGTTNTGSGNSGTTAFGGTSKTSSAGGGGSSGSSAGSSGASLSSLGDTRTSPLTLSDATGANGNGSALDTSGLSNAANGAGVYANGSGGGGSRSSEKGFNPFASLLGGDGQGNGAGNGSGNSSLEFRRDPASIAGQAALRNGLGPMGTQDPANYFGMLKVNDNLFKIVERRYESKSRQWAISDAQQIRRSIQQP